MQGFGCGGCGDGPWRESALPAVGQETGSNNVIFYGFVMFYGRGTGEWLARDARADGGDSPPGEQFLADYGKGYYKISRLSPGVFNGKRKLDGARMRNGPPLTRWRRSFSRTCGAGAYCRAWRGRPGE